MTKTKRKARNKRKARKTYSYFERALMLLPKLSVAECLLLRDAIELPTPEHIAYIRNSLKYKNWHSYQRTINPDKRVKIYDDPNRPWREYVHYTDDRDGWELVDEDEYRKRVLTPMIVSDKPLP